MIIDPGHAMLTVVKTNFTITLDIEMVEQLQMMARQTEVNRSRLVARALTMLFNEHALTVRRAEGGPMWLPPIKPLTVPDPAGDGADAALTEPPTRPTPSVAPTELPAPPGVPAGAGPTSAPGTAVDTLEAQVPLPADPHVAPMANGGPPRPAPFFPPRSRSVTLE